MTYVLPRRLRFNAADMDRANQVWGANCGPGAIAAMLGLTLDDVRPALGDFEQKRYTNPTLMFETLLRLKAKFNWEQDAVEPAFPKYGLARIQWEGPWTKPGVPIAARYRHTHWVGAVTIPAPLPPNVREAVGIFDINLIDNGGWTTLTGWRDICVPWLLEQVEPKADGNWHITHSVEIQL